MFRRGRKSLIVTVLLAALTTAPVALAEAAGPGALNVSDLWSRVLGWFTNAWVDHGPAVDRNGQPRLTAEGDEGPAIDPDGRAFADHGPAIDPNGRARLTAEGDGGTHIDPDGQPR